MLSADESLDLSNLSLDMIKQWPVFPFSMNRSKLPGFYIHWPKGEDFEALYANFTILYPDSGVSIDKLGLMAVWLTMRLPYYVDVDLQSGELLGEVEQPPQEPGP